MVDNLERQMSRSLRANWHGWITFFEPALGSDFGIPDAEVFVWRQCVHIELKSAVLVAKVGKPVVLKSKEIRPAQILWHENAVEAGVPCFFLFGVLGDAGEVWHLFAGKLGAVKENWKKGLVLNEHVHFVGLMPAKRPEKAVAVTAAITKYITEHVIS